MRISFLFIGLFLAISTFAQKSSFKLQSSGDFLDSVTSKNYSVFEFQGKSKTELYTMILKNVSSIYVSPKHVLDKVEDEMISISAETQESIPNTVLGMKVYCSFGYKIVYEFKDGKIKVNSPKILSITAGNRFTSLNGIFDKWLKTQKVYKFKNGESTPNKPETINAINGEFNSIIESSISSSNTKKDDW